MTNYINKENVHPYLTVFTPTFNRGYTLERLYISLCTQTSLDFEWLIVDDGSTDNTNDLVESWIKENKIQIRYIKQKNGGKHRAINRGVNEANGSFFFIVDSDDCLAPDSIEWINNIASSIICDNEFAGLSGVCIDLEGNKVGGGNNFGVIDCSSIDIRNKFGIKGDLAEIFKTAVLKEFPFPEIDNEQFCPEALVWNRIARKYKLRYCYKGIYVCEYLRDGLTAKITRIRHQSPKASMIYYSEYYHDNIPLKNRFKAAINFWRFQNDLYCREYQMHSPLALLGWIPGKIMALLDKRK